MIEIPTTRDLTILVDDEDAVLVEGFSWYAVPGHNGRFYAHARYLGTGWRMLMHRLIMGAPQGLHVHHKNNNGLDNRREKS